VRPIVCRITLSQHLESVTVFELLLVVAYNLSKTDVEAGYTTPNPRLRTIFQSIMRMVGKCKERFSQQ